MMTKKSHNRNRLWGDRLWDDAGLEWQHAGTGLSRNEVLVLLKRPDVRVGIHQHFNTPLRWVADAQKWEIWRREIEPSFSDGLGRFDNPLPFRAKLWRCGKRELLLFDDLD